MNIVFFMEENTEIIILDLVNQISRPTHPFKLKSGESQTGCNNFMLTSFRFSFPFIFVLDHDT